MNDQHNYFDYEALIREARMERSLVIGRAIANGVGALSSLVSRANAALWHPSVKTKSTARSDTASARSDTASAHR
ncbi:MAG: hypothetical protein ABI831_15875 [Betaproteobacteria bacterium]